MEYQVMFNIRHFSLLVNRSSVTSKHIYINNSINCKTYYNYYTLSGSQAQTVETRLLPEW